MTAAVTGVSSPEPPDPDPPDLTSALQSLPLLFASLSLLSPFQI
ncbi:unnamed protein product [Brassica oleracea var. botrytis]